MPGPSDIRFYAAYLLSNIGRFLESLYPVILRPRQLMDVERRGYATPGNIQAWSRNFRGGLNDTERYLIESYTDKKGDFLVLKSSSGREGQDLAKIGFNVTGVEWVKELIEVAKGRAKEENLKINYIRGDIHKLEEIPVKFNYAMLAAGDYSAIISRRLRIEWIRRLKGLLKDKGRVFLSYQKDEPTNFEKKTYRLRKLVAYLTLGNFDYQIGDRKITDRLYMHSFATDDEVAKEAEEVGFRVLAAGIQKTLTRPWIALEKL